MSREYSPGYWVVKPNRGAGRHEIRHREIRTRRVIKLPTLIYDLKLEEIGSILFFFF